MWDLKYLVVFTFVYLIISWLCRQCCSTVLKLVLYLLKAAVINSCIVIFIWTLRRRNSGKNLQNKNHQSQTGLSFFRQPWVNMRHIGKRNTHMYIQGQKLWKLNMRSYLLVELLWFVCLCLQLFVNRKVRCSYWMKGIHFVYKWWIISIEFHYYWSKGHFDEALKVKYFQLLPKLKPEVYFFSLCQT